MSPRHRVSPDTPPRKADTFDATLPEPAPSFQKTRAGNAGIPRSVANTLPWSPLNNLDRQNSMVTAMVLASESPLRAPAQSVLGGKVFRTFDAVPDGDDITLEPVRGGANEGVSFP